MPFFCILKSLSSKQTEIICHVMYTLKPLQSLFMLSSCASKQISDVRMDVLAVNHKLSLSQNIKLAGPWTLFEKTTTWQHKNKPTIQQLTMSMKFLVSMLSTQHNMPVKSPLLSCNIDPLKKLCSLSFIYHIYCSTSQGSPKDLKKAENGLKCQKGTHGFSFYHIPMKHLYRPPSRWAHMQRKMKQNNGVHFCVHV